MRRREHAQDDEKAEAKHRVIKGDLPEAVTLKMAWMVIANKGKGSRVSSPLIQKFQITTMKAFRGIRRANT